MAMASKELLLLFLSFSLSSPFVSAESKRNCMQENCVYTVYVRTGSIWNGGTDTNISLSVMDSYGLEVNMDNIKAWGGLMGTGYKYFERGNLDIFSGRGPCLPSPVCKMVLSSNGTGAHHGWFCNYVEVTSTGPQVECQQHVFTVEQWLSTDVAPYDLIAVRDHCSADQRLNSVPPRSLQL